MNNQPILNGPSAHGPPLYFNSTTLKNGFGITIYSEFTISTFTTTNLRTRRGTNSNCLSTLGSRPCSAGRGRNDWRRRSTFRIASTLRGGMRVLGELLGILKTLIIDVVLIDLHWSCFHSIGSESSMWTNLLPTCPTNSTRTSS